MPDLSNEQIAEIIQAARVEDGLQYALGNRDGTFLMLGLVIESAKDAARRGVPFETWIGDMQAMLEEHRES